MAGAAFLEEYVGTDHRAICLGIVLLGAMLFDRTIGAIRSGVIDSAYLSLGSIRRSERPKLFVFWCATYSLLWLSMMVVGFSYLFA